MRHRTAALAFAGAAAIGAAAIGAAAATLLAECSADRIDRTYRAMARAFFTMPPMDSPAVSRPALRLLRGDGEHGPG